MKTEEWFGSRLRELREQAGLTQPELAEKAGLSKRGISDIERGARGVTWGVVLKLAAALGVDCAAFQVRPASTDPAPQGRPKGTTKKPAAKGKRKPPAGGG